MRRLACALLVACAMQWACEEDPAHAVKVDHPAAVTAPASSSPQVASAQAPAGGIRPPVVWRPELCPPPPEPAGGPSALIGVGPCAFQQQGAARCSLTDDDLIMEAVRPMPNDALFTVYVSIETFHRPGTFDNAEFVIGVQDAKGLYRWASDKVHIRVPPDENSVALAEAHLRAVAPMQAPELVVSGTLTCGQRADARTVTK